MEWGLLGRVLKVKELHEEVTLLRWGGRAGLMVTALILKHQLCESKERLYVFMSI